MNRRALFQLFASAAVGAKAALARLGAPRKLYTLYGPNADVLTISVAQDLPVALKPGDRLSVTFSGSDPKLMLITESWDGIKACRNFADQYGLPENGSTVNAFIAPRNCEITDIRIASATHGELKWSLHRWEPQSL